MCLLQDLPERPGRPVRLYRRAIGLQTSLFQGRPNWYSSRPLTPTCNDTHGGQGRRQSLSDCQPASYDSRTQSQSPQIPAETRHHCRALAGKRAAVPREACFIATAPRVNTPTTGRWGSSPPVRRGSARAYYIIVVLTSGWPRSSWTVRMSYPLSSRCVWNECRSVWHPTRFTSPAFRPASVTARCAADSWR
jgi:hypothetical protein